MSLLAPLKQSDLFAFNLRNRDRWVAQQAALLPKGARVLDAGAGSAPYRPLFAHCRYETQDFKQLENHQLRHAAYAPMDYVCDITGIPVEDATFDAVLCTEVIEHHPEPIRVLYELARILKPGGRLLVTAPLGSGIHQEPFHYYGGFTPYWYRAFLEKAGFETIAVVPNGGSYRHFAQESVRFVRETRPFGPMLPATTSVAWAPLWLLLAPVLGLAVPLTCSWLDRFDKECRFTVGYHVTATRAPI